MKKFYWSIFEDTPSLTIMSMEDFHDYTMMILTMITSFLMILMMKLITCKFKNLFLLEGQTLELLWTILPMVILVFIAYPSLFYLYFSDLSLNPSVSMKVFGAQWFWIYELTDFKSINFSSYYLNDEEMMTKNKPFLLGWRLLECDTRAVLPMNSEIRIMVTSQDVIHSFAIPSLSLKVDAIPGRLNWMTTFIKRPGLYYGQCSEICGVGHAFMPISVDVINKEDFIKFVKTFN
uniref:Cytochrome c oxidase subunit 2 n=1 Tax=Rhipiphorothrips cruentatus TaxID=764491 RepID=A0A8A5L5H2_9NEOP|nr:cytochrome c oxidase subunit 2 [Rhipiphorothrips cruentatus]